MSLKDGLGLTAARQDANAIIGAVAKGGDPLGAKRKAAAAAGNTLRSIAEAYFKRDGKKLRSLDQRRRMFERLIFPKFGAREIGDIRRSEIVSFLDRIEDENGTGTAHVVLLPLETVQLARRKGRRFPVAHRSGMGRVKAIEQARARFYRMTS
jgi:hypothetical protein